MEALVNYVAALGSPAAASAQLGITATSITKMLTGKGLSGPTLRKLRQALLRHGFRSVPELPMHRKHRVSPDLYRSDPRTTRSLFITAKLKEIVKSESDLLNLAPKCGVTATSLKKILEGRPITRYVAQKVFEGLSAPNIREIARRPSTQAEKLKNVYALYQNLGTLEAVGHHLGVTRERVRQLLEQGNKWGLFNYTPRNYPFVPKEKLIADYKKASNLGAVARLNGVSVNYLQKLLTAYSVTERHLESYRTEARKAECIEGFNRIADEIGHPPTSFELQRARKGRALYNRITRLWGSIRTFRAELSIPRPRRIRPHWLEPLREIALIKRMQHLDTLRDVLSTTVPLSIGDMCNETNFGANRVRRLVALLNATGEVRRIGEATNTKYLLSNELR